MENNDFLNNLKKAVDEGKFNSDAANKINEISELSKKKEIKTNIFSRSMFEMDDEDENKMRQILDQSQKNNDSAFSEAMEYRNDVKALDKKIENRVEEIMKESGEKTDEVTHLTHEEMLEINRKAVEKLKRDYSNAKIHKAIAILENFDMKIMKTVDELKESVDFIENMVETYDFDKEYDYYKILLEIVEDIKKKYYFDEYHSDDEIENPNE